MIRLKELLQGYQGIVGVSQAFSWLDRALGGFLGGVQSLGFGGFGVLGLC